MSNYTYKTKSRLIKGNKCTGRQLQFIEHYLKPGPTYLNGAQSALAMGISPVRARQAAYGYLRRLAVKNLIQETLAKRKETINNTYKENLEYAMHIRNTSASLEEKDHKNMDKEAALKAIQEINKMEGNYAPDKHATLSVNAETDIIELDEKIKEYEKEF